MLGEGTVPRVNVGRRNYLAAWRSKRMKTRDRSKQIPTPAKILRVGAHREHETVEAAEFIPGVEEDGGIVHQGILREPVTLHLSDAEASEAVLRDRMRHGEPGRDGYIQLQAPVRDRSDVPGQELAVTCLDRLQIAGMPREGQGDNEDGLHRRGGR